MIDRIQFCFRHAAKVKTLREIRFGSGLNILVGPNGSGKSTVLRALHDCEQCRKEESHGGVIRYFNAESMNPHAPTGPPGDIRNMILRTRGMFASHGEIMRTTLTSQPLAAGDTFLVDEPESGQDAASVRSIRRGFDAICRNGIQIIVATHHPLLLPDARVIELKLGYLEELRAAYRSACCGVDGSLPRWRVLKPLPKEEHDEKAANDGDL